MVGLDTNVLVRYFAQDDDLQSPKANRMMEALSDDEPGFISMVSMVELVWVMQSVYQADRATITRILQTLLSVSTITIENTETVLKALRIYSNTQSDFADCLIVKSCEDAGCKTIMTFDVNAAKRCGMQLA
jgi:predicted nucleic-acid-binding protein